MSPPENKVTVQVDGRTLVLTNLDKVLYPAVGFTKAQVLDYYTRVAPVLLPHLRDRALTLKRYPNGVDESFFFAKNAPRHTPSWVRTARLPSPGSIRNREEIDYLLIDGLPGLVWAANLAGLELHTPMWRVRRGPKATLEPADPDLLVFDLDPGPPATIVECCRVALLLRAALAADGFEPLPKTSGNKGLQLYAAVRGGTAEDTSAYARELARRLERELPDLVVWRMAKALRGGKVFLDWSQNNAAKTTVSVYSLRARAEPTVSTPLSWAEVESCRSAADLVFPSGAVLDRVAARGDLFARLLRPGPPLPR